MHLWAIDCYEHRLRTFLTLDLAALEDVGVCWRLPDAADGHQPDQVVMRKRPGTPS